MSPTFRYTAKNWEGKTTEGAYAAKTLREALEHLRSQNLFVLSIKEQAPPREQRSLFASFAGLASRRKPKTRDFMVFCRQFATMLKAGITVLEILKVQAAQVDKPSFRVCLKDVVVDVEKGSSLSEAMGRHDELFPRIMITMTEAGEAGGILDEVMERLAVHFENQHNTEEKIRSATTYPIIISIVAVLVMCLMVFFVLPQFSKIFAQMGFELPFITRALIWVAETAQRFWYLIFGLLAVAVFGAAHYIRTPRGKEKFDRLCLRFPILGPVYHKSMIARFSRTLSTLLSSGVSLISSLELVEKIISNSVLTAVINRTCQVIRQGQPMALPLAASGMFPPMIVEMVHVGEESGALDDMLSRTADFYENEVSFVLDRLGTMIEPILLIGIGFFVGLLLLSIMMPMFQIYEMIDQASAIIQGSTWGILLT